MRVAGSVTRSFQSLLIAASLTLPLSAPAAELTPQQQLTHDIELVEINVRFHARDERVLVKSFYQGQEYLYRLVKALAGGK